MSEYINYLIQSGITMTILYGIYWMFLRKDTFYSANRFYLVSALLLSSIFPLFKISVSGANAVFDIQMLEPVIITPGIVAEGLQSKLSLGDSLLLGYMLITSMFFARFSIQLIRLIILMRKYGVTNYQGVKLIVVDNDYMPFSIFNLIVINRNILNTPAFNKIIEHEKAHIRQLHSLDLMILEILSIIQWYNPVLWLYRRSIISTHEYLADASVLSLGYKTTEYQELLLNQTLGVQFISISNSLNHSLIKKRFIMMTKERSKKINLLKMVFVIPAAIVLSLIFSLTFTDNVLAQSNSQDNKMEMKESKDLMAQNSQQQDEPVFTVVEEMPTYPGGKEAMYKYLSTNIKYPEEARKNGISGIVYITYVVEKSGKITNIRVLRGVNEELDKEAVRVVSEMPDWKPGKEKGKPVRVQFNLPISYRLDGDDKKGEEKKGSPREYQDVKKIDK